MPDISELNQPRSQRWVATRAGVGTQTLRSLHRIGLMPAASQMCTADVVLALCAQALGATQSTNRKTKAGERTEAALARNQRVMNLARELLSSGSFDRRTTLVVDGHRVEVKHALEAVAEWLHADVDAPDSLVLIPLGKWALQAAADGGADCESVPVLAG
ncbi:hypothetical protein ABZ864_47765 [Streptomyces sp. NPDC047082]|uniref:hypothetical protein n=1 Tax=Streptomyces sp. NPDC047082 TaxID=3155259 RepID=UPI0033F66DB1